MSRPAEQANPTTVFSENMTRRMAAVIVCFLAFFISSQCKGSAIGLESRAKIALIEFSAISPILAVFFMPLTTARNGCSSLIVFDNFEKKLSCIKL